MSDESGDFVRLDCTACGRRDAFLKCDGCGARDRFTLVEGGVRCRCGASYTHGVCLCGAEVPRGRLIAVPFAEGPVIWSDLEVDPVRMAVLATLLVAVIVGLWWWFA